LALSAKRAVCGDHGRRATGLLLSARHADGLSSPFHRWSELDRKSTRLNSSHRTISYAVFCLKKKKNIIRSKRYESWRSPTCIAVRPDLSTSYPPTRPIASSSF